MKQLAGQIRRNGKPWVCSPTLGAAVRNRAILVNGPTQAILIGCGDVADLRVGCLLDEAATENPATAVHATVEHHLTEGNNEILKIVLEEIANLEKDFRKIQNYDVSEMNFLKQ